MEFLNYIIGKFKILMSVLAVTSFLLSLWAVPIGLLVMAFALFETLWIKITLCVMAAIWTYLFRPWNIFTNPRWPQFVRDMKIAIIVFFRG